MPGKKFIQIFNASAHKTSTQLSGSDAFEVVHEITKSNSMSPAVKWSLIRDFVQNDITVGEIKSQLVDD